ncbi:replicative DNA helicase [Caulobacter sp. SLTY]|uniref:replicative DNA helicase n=1 Tax=Caulobacter sp. SLTY TaxID=2683262 RepID=UPI0014134F8B|nr:replicative DNA helicase [Caulobacter sp. SLTY]NBB17089.1 replicative DNA helicase [Caulobacter sp. SLTY]
MAIVPALDLRPVPTDPAPQHLPSNIEAEQALLGALLYDNAAYERLSDRLGPTHFFEPFHQRLFASMESHIRKGQLAEPILLADQFRADPAFQELGGLRYLADLVDRAPPAANAPDYARVVYELAVRRDLIRIGGEIAADAGTPDAERDSRDQIEIAEQKLYTLAESGTASTGFVGFADALRGAVEMAAEAYSRDGGLAGTSTGLMDLDQKMGGLHPSDLLILAGRPSMGKTALATNIAFNVAKSYAWEPQPDGSKKTVSGGVVAFFSLEMSAEQLALRLLADASGVSGDRLRKGEIDASEFGRVRDAAMEIQEAPLYIDATGGLSIAKLVARSRRLKRSVGLDLIVVDYLQLVTGGEGKSDNRVQEVSMITQGLKALAKELSVPVLALSQLSRQVENREDKRPQLSDLRESGSIEQDADMVMFVYRESYYLGRAEPDTADQAKHMEWQEKMDRVAGMAEVIIGKQRHGPIGTVKLHFNEDLTKFGNLAREGRFEVR